MDVQAYLLALALILGVGVAAWAVSVAIRNVAFVDSLWSLFFLIAALVCAAAATPNNEPGFAIKSLYIVFGLQGVLAWVIAMPLMPAIMSPGGIGPIEVLAALLWLVGFVFEAGGDYQLARFKRDESNRGRVLNTGLWRYTRHPNYFGDFCVWWAFYLFAFSAGGWWTVVSPVLMSFLLLKVSGVAMLEKTIADRRPEYAEYIRRTNAFFPGMPKSVSTT